MITLKMDRKKLLVSVMVMVVAVALVFFGSILQWKVQAADNNGSQEAKRTLNVAGQGTIQIAPDIAYVTLGVITEDKDAKAAQQKNAEAMAAVVAKIKASGVKSEDIKTMNYNISPKYNYIQNTGTSEIIGYQVSNSVQVTVKDITKTGNIIDAASESGMNMSSSISFGLSNYEKSYNDALKKAVEVAKQRAKTIADTMGITLKSPISINENGGYEPVYGMGASYAMDMKSAASVATPVESGNITVRANVNITYEY